MQYTGRNRRLYNEWQMMEQSLASHPLVSCHVERNNSAGLPIEYRIGYDIPSFCGVEDIDHVNQAGVVNHPIIAPHFEMIIYLPDNYPCVDGLPRYCFTPMGADGQEIAMPWHPNIRYFGMMAGRVCLNMPDTYASLAQAVMRIARYLTYDIYHAEAMPPYPEDLTVAQWVREQAEPMGWISMCTKRI